MRVHFAPAAETQLLVDNYGRPVIPIASNTELNSVHRIIELHNCDLVEVPAKPVRESSLAPHRAGLVVALGRNATPAALLYAHLTGRRCCQAEQLKDLPLDVEVAVVVLTTERIDHGFMDQICRRRARHQRAVPGILTAVAAQDLSLVAKRSAAALACAGAAVAGRTLIYPSSKFRRVERAEGLFIGGEEPRSGLIGAMSSGSALLAMFVHSQGLDITVRGDLRLCPLPLERHTDAVLRPLCLEIGRCTMTMNLPTREEAWRSGTLTSFSNIRAQLLVMHGCNIVRLTDQILDPAFNLAPLFELEASLGACITSWQRERLDREGLVLHSLLNDLSDGRQAGRALRDFNVSDTAAFLQINLCLLGDPDYAIAPLAHLRPLPAAPPPTERHPPRYGERLIDLALVNLIYTMLHDAPERYPMKPFKRDAQLRLALHRLVTGLIAGFAKQKIDQLWIEVHEPLTEFIACWPWLENLVEPFGRAGKPGLERVCEACGQPARSYPFHFHVDAILSWTFIECEACDAFICGPPEWSELLSLADVHAGRLRLRQSGIRGRGIVCVLSASWRYCTSPPPAHASLLLPWPLNDDGTLNCEFALPQPLPIGQLQCHIILGCGEKLGSWAVKLRSLTTPAAAADQEPELSGAIATMPFGGTSRS
jgi:hypothetical protein